MYKTVFSHYRPKAPCRKHKRAVSLAARNLKMPALIAFDPHQDVRGLSLIPFVCCNHLDLTIKPTTLAVKLTELKVGPGVFGDIYNTTVKKGQVMGSLINGKATVNAHPVIPFVEEWNKSLLNFYSEIKAQCALLNEVTDQVIVECKRAVIRAHKDSSNSSDGINKVRYWAILHSAIDTPDKVAQVLRPHCVVDHSVGYYGKKTTVYPHAINNPRYLGPKGGLTGQYLYLVAAASTDRPNVLRNTPGVLLRLTYASNWQCLFAQFNNAKTPVPLAYMKIGIRLSDDTVEYCRDGWNHNVSGKHHAFQNIYKELLVGVEANEILGTHYSNVRTMTEVLRA